MMSCRQARRHFSALLDGCLVPQLDEDLKKHLSSCATCRREFTLQQSIGMALRAGKTKQAPYGFTQKVMACIDTRESKVKDQASGIRKNLKAILINKKVSRLRYGFAVAVACLLVAGTSFGLGIKYPEYSFTHLKHMVAQNKNEPSHFSQKIGPEKDKKGQLKTNVATNNQPEVKSQGKKQPEAQNKENNDPDLIKNNSVSDKKSNNKDTKVAANIPVTNNTPANKYEPRVFLNQPCLCESALYKLKVDNFAQAQQKVLALTKAAGVNCQNLGQQQANGKLIGLLRLEVPITKTKDFTAQILTIGKVYDQQIEKRDLSTKYAETLRRYQDLITQRQNAPIEQVPALDEQIKDLEQQLTVWDKKAKYQVIIIWLEEGKIKEIGVR